jgi:hypothetical protein
MEKHKLEYKEIIVRFATTRKQTTLDLLNKVNLVTSIGILPIKLLLPRDN